MIDAKPARRPPPRGLCVTIRLLALALLLPGAAARAAGTLALTPVADGIHVYVGPHAEAGAANLGAVGNAAVVVGSRSVAVIDTGGSLAFGRQLLAAVRGITDLPVSHVINTHVHPDHTLGNAAFDAPHTRFVGHHKLPRAMASRTPHYLDSFARLVGPDFAGTRGVAPGITVTGTLEIDLGDRRLRLTAHRTAHTDNDLTVYDPRTGTLFAGDLLFLERLPVVDGSLKGWLAVLEDLRGGAPGPIRRVVPGHGPASAPWPAALADQARYLEALLAGTRDAVARGIGIRAAIAGVAADERGRWLLFEDNHPRNVTASYTELEWE